MPTLEKHAGKETGLKPRGEAGLVQSGTSVPRGAAAARVGYLPLPLEQVRSDVMQILTDKGAIELAEKEGRAALEKLQKGEAVSLSWSPAQPVSLQKRQGLHPEGAQAVFGADVTKLPVYAGVPAAQGRFVVYRITKVKDLTAIDPEHRKRLSKQLAEMAGQEQYAAYLASLRQRTDVKVDRKRLEGDAGR